MPSSEGDFAAKSLAMKAAPDLFCRAAAQFNPGLAIMDAKYNWVIGVMTLDGGDNLIFPGKNNPQPSHKGMREYEFPRNSGEIRLFWNNRG